MDNIVLGERYSLLEKISEGGMSTIYKAYCNVLNRIVAVKILKQEFSNDEEFLIKFNNEAKSAASLNHPNIIGVYDIDRDDDVSYIVMEYVDGKNIKQLIKEKGGFVEKEALDIIRQICVALKAAHDQGIVHRDIKPHNIMINKSGVVKVGDFGIAKATSNATITLSDNIMGSVHYISPEQAKGEHVDKRSDIYSLGIVFYEMLTGTVPFNDDKPVNIALKHVNSEVQIPEKYKNIISPSVQNIILKMTQKIPSQRYLDVSSIIADIDKIVIKNEEISYFEDEDYKTRIISPIKKEDVKEEITSDRKVKKRGLKKILALVTLLVVVLTCGFLIFASDIWDSIAGNNVLIPDIKGKKLEEAQESLEKVGLKIKVMSEKEDSKNEKGTVLEQNPDFGIKLRKGEEVSVVISKEPSDITTIPDVVGKTIEEAKNLVEEKKLKISIEYSNSETVEENKIISQSPEKDKEARFNDIVTVIASKGKEIKQAKVPSLIGLSLDDAKNNSGNFEIGNISYEENSSKPDGTVLYQNPKSGTMHKIGSAIDVVINKLPKVEPSPPPVEKEIVSRDIVLVLPQRDNVMLTLVDKTDGSTVYRSTLNIVEGENVVVSVSGNKGDTKEYNIYLGGVYYATTGSITF